MQQPQLFPAHVLPEGMVYETDFLAPAEEQRLIETIRALPLAQAEYKEWVARRRIASYGARFDFTHNVLRQADPVPSFLHPLRARVAAWSGLPATHFNHALIAEYSPGAQLGWHRDVPAFETIVGVSLAGSGRMRLRPYPPRADGRAVHAVDVERRSAYILRGPARWRWQHAISPARELRYSITFRTLVA